MPVENYGRQIAGRYFGGTVEVVQDHAVIALPTATGTNL
jgi:hypothetical protein